MRCTIVGNIHRRVIIGTDKLPPSSSMANPIPLYHRIRGKNHLQRTVDIFIFFLLVSLLIYRLRSVNNHGLVWFLAFLCESWFTFNWILVMNVKWSPVEFKTYPDRLLSRYHIELPPVDIFVTTADPMLEPPIITVNTVLSMLALDYPANKLACYVSDDGASPLTFYALEEAIKFAKHWVPFCKKYKLMVRAPFRYFSGMESETCEVSSEFQKDWIHVKNEYGELCRKIEKPTQNSDLCDTTTGASPDFTKIERRNHPSIVKVIWENKDNLPDGVPHLVYVSREKRPKHPHHFKAGAMNVLTRVSGVMTNSPFMLNVDCDMFANNPQIVLHAMCIILDCDTEQNYAYVQTPQYFYGGIKDDPFGNQLIVLQQSFGGGVAGIQGPFYIGTGCLHTRRVIYGLSPEETNIKENGLVAAYEEDALKRKFGYSLDFTKSAAQALSGKYEISKDLSTSLKAAIQVADCSYESNTLWGKKFGWVYGSMTEDVLTGLGIQEKGWKSAYCTPDPPAFLGCAPSGGPACMIQQKRGATGLLEIFFSRKSPIVAMVTKHLGFRQCLAYLYINTWALRSIPELCYSLLPVYCILTNSSFMPKVTEKAILIPTSIFLVYNVYTMAEYLGNQLPIRAWWNNQRMMRITTISAYLFGVIGVALKLIGVSDTVFEVTRKYQSDDEDGSDVHPGSFTFDDSPMFVLGTGLVVAQMTALVVGMLRAYSWAENENEFGPGEIICSLWVLLSFLPFVKGLFGKGKYGIPTSTICKGVALVAFFVHFCIWVSRT